MSILRWFSERFPFPHVLLALTLFIALRRGTNAAIVAEPFFWVGELIGAIGAVAIFVMLRAFDDRKDAAHDRIHHPDRPVARGLVSPRALGVLAAVMIGLQALATAMSTGGDAWSAVWVLWIITLVWALLMEREFFIGGWLGARFLLYSATHQLITPLIFLWLAHLGSPGWLPVPVLVSVAASGVCVGLLFEVGRKALPSSMDPERSAERTYGDVLRPTGVATLLVVCAVGLAACHLAHLGFVRPLGDSLFLPILLCVAPLNMVGLVVRWRWRLRHGVARSIEMPLGMLVLLQFLIFAAVVEPPAG